MLRKLKLQRLLHRLAHKEELITSDDYILFREIVRANFPADHWLAQQCNAIDKTFAPSNEGEAGGNKTAEIQKVKSLAATALDLIRKLGVPGNQDPQDQREIEQLVDQSFHGSRLFNVTKWVLAISLALVGIGSLGFAGINILAQDRLQEAQKRLSATNDEVIKLTQRLQSQQSDLETKQTETIKNIEKLILGYSAQAKLTLDGRLAEIDADLTKRMNAAITKIDAFADAAVKRISAAEGIATKRVGTSAETGVSAIAKRSAEHEASVRAAINDLEEQRKKLAGSIGTTAGEARKRLDEATAAQLSRIDVETKAKIQLIDEAMRARVQTIGQRAEGEISSLATSREQYRTRLELTFEKVVAGLNDTLRGRLTDLGNSSGDAARRISAITSEVASHEQRFVSGMTQRLRGWDQRVTAEEARFEELTKSATTLQANLKGLTNSLTALQSSSGPALEVAARLSEGTATGTLQQIGTILERSAILVGLAFATGVLGLLLSIVALILMRRSRTAKPPGAAAA